MKSGTSEAPPGKQRWFDRMAIVLWRFAVTTAAVVFVEVEEAATLFHQCQRRNLLNGKCARRCSTLAQKIGLQFLPR
jgi:hypothetical protein